jgi:hypothetical protein
VTPLRQHEESEFARIVRVMRRRIWVILACFLIATNLIIFFVWTYPANVATNNWTVVPANWNDLRLQWEYSHAANAVVMFIAFCTATLSVVTNK